MAENKIKEQIEITLNSISKDYKCVVYNNDIDLAYTALYDYIGAYGYLFSDEILEHLKITLKFLSNESPSIDSDIYDVFDTFSVLVYEKRGLNNDW